jgi:ABC-2 type transport system permease protein
MVIKKILSKQNRALLRELVATDFKLRYQGSALGYAWSLLRPLLLFCILYVVFIKFMHIDFGIQHSAVYLLLGIVIWNFFGEMTSLSVGSIVGRGDLIRKIRIPRWIIVISSSLTALINLALNLVVVAVFMAVNHVDLMSSVVFLPILLIEVYLCALGLSLILAAAFVRFRDVSYIWEVALQMLFYLTPIIYPLSRIPYESLQQFVLLNPVAQVIQDSRYVLISHQTPTLHNIGAPTWIMIIPYSLPLLLFVVGLLYFKRESRSFAENI